MSNVLPPDAQRSVWRMYRARFVLAGSLVALVAASVAGLALLPMYLALHAGEVPPPASSLEIPVSEAQAARAAVLHSQSLLSALTPFAPAATSTSEVIGAALSLRPKGIVVDHVSYSSGEPSQIMLVGLASTRDAINAYRQALQVDKHFKSVSVPIGDLVGTQDGRFTVTLLGDF